MAQSKLFTIGQVQVIVGRLSPTLALCTVRTVSVADYTGPRPAPPSARCGKQTIFTMVRKTSQLAVLANETDLVIAQRLAAQVKKPQRGTMGRRA